PPYRMEGFLSPPVTVNEQRDHAVAVSPFTSIMKFVSRWYADPGFPFAVAPRFFSIKAWMAAGLWQNRTRQPTPRFWRTIANIQPGRERRASAHSSLTDRVSPGYLQAAEFALQGTTAMRAAWEKIRIAEFFISELPFPRNTRNAANNITLIGELQICSAQTPSMCLLTPKKDCAPARSRS